MPDWVINDNGIRIPTTTEPASPVANSMQIYATATGIHAKDEHGNVERLGVTDVATKLIASDKITTSSVSQIDVPITALDDDYYMLKLIMLLSPIDTTQRALRLTFNNDATTNAYYYKRYGATATLNTYIDINWRTPDADYAYTTATRYRAEMELWDWGNSLRQASVYTRANQYANDSDIISFGNYQSTANVTSINIFEDGNRLFGVGTEWFLLGYLR
jgi:hypothetical protein